MKPYLFLKVCLLVYFISIQIVMWGQCADGECVFIHEELSSKYTFKYQSAIINDQPKRAFAGGEIVDADFSRKNGILRVSLYGLQVEGPASRKQVLIRTKKVWLSSGPEFKKPEDNSIKLLPVGQRISLDLKFEAIPNSNNGRGQIRVEYTAVIDGNEILFRNNHSRPHFTINYDFKSFKEDADPSPLGRSDPIKEKLAELDVIVTNKKADKATQWFLPYLDAYDGTSDPKLKAPLENRLEGCCKELYEESKTRPELEEFIRLYNVGHRLNCEAFGSFISKATKKLEAFPRDSPPNEEELRTTTPNPSPIRQSNDAEKIAWQKAQKTQTIHAYQNYINKYSRGKHRSEAMMAIQNIEKADQEALKELENALKNTPNDKDKIAVCQRFLAKQPGVNFKLCHERANATLRELSSFHAKLVTPSPGGVDFVLSVKSQKALDPQVEVSRNGIPLSNQEVETSPWSSKGPDNTYEKEYKYLEPGEYTFILKFIDASPPKKYTTTVTSELAPNVVVTGDELRIIGGNPPFKIYFSTDGDDPTGANQFSIEEEIGPKRLFNIKDLFKKKEIETKNLRYRVMDNFDEPIGPIQKIKQPVDWFYWAILASVLIGLGFIVSSFFYLGKDKIYTWMAKQPVLLNQFKWLEAYKKTIKKTQETNATDATTPATPTTPAEKLSVKIKAPKEISKESPSIGIKIKTTEAKTSTPADASPMLAERGYTNVEPVGNPSVFHTFELDKLWINTAVSKVYIHRRCVADIEIEVNNYLMKCVSKSVVKPEIGGFLMGQYGQCSDGRYFVVIYDYIKAHTTAHDEYEVELAMEDIDDPLRAVPEYGLMGWFHTHPGHTVFLSGRDLNIQKTHFNRPYQIAMETDPVSADYDLAFFTWQNGSGLNQGASDRVTGSWLSWKTLNDWVRAIR